MLPIKPKKSRFMLLSVLGAAILGAPALASAEVTGSIGAVSNYIFRGFNQSTGAAVQGGLSYTHASGFYVSYWGSTVNYAVVGGPASYSGNTNVAAAQVSGTENDLGIGYNGKAGDFSYGIGLLGYVYPQANHNNGAELAGKVGYGPLTVSANYSLVDAYWTSRGDLYTNAAVTFPLPQDFTLGANAGMYFWKTNSTNYIDCSAGCKSSTFTDATLSLSHPLPVKGATMSVNYTKGGKDRFDNKIGDNAWLGMGFTF